MADSSNDKSVQSDDSVSLRPCTGNRLFGSSKKDKRNTSSAMETASIDLSSVMPKTENLMSSSFCVDHTRIISDRYKKTYSQNSRNNQESNLNYSSKDSSYLSAMSRQQGSAKRRRESFSMDNLNRDDRPVKECHLSIEEKKAIEQQAATHCNKNFVLRSATKANASPPSHRIFADIIAELFPGIEDVKPCETKTNVSIAAAEPDSSPTTNTTSSTAATEPIPASPTEAEPTSRSSAAENGQEELFHLPPVDRLFTAPHWKVEYLQGLKWHLNCVKGKTDRGDYVKQWADHTANVNPAGSVFAAVKECAAPELLTQAFLKFYEVLSRYPIVPETCTRLSSVHLCEAPGAFIAAMNHFNKLYRPFMQWEWVANTLHPHYEGCRQSQCIPDDRLIQHTLDNWCWGHDGTGDLMKRSCLHSLEERCAALQSPVELVTADGSIDCQSNPGEQEQMTMQLHYCEIVAALHLLNKRGSFVLKKFTFFETSSLCILYLLCCTFKEVIVYKPITSKLGNSEVYLVCFDYVGKDEITEYLDVLLGAYSSKTPANCLFSESDIPQSFVSLVIECAEYFTNHQITAMVRNERLFSVLTVKERTFCNYLKTEVKDIFKKNNPIQILPTEDTILKRRIIWDYNIHPTFYKYRKWTGTLLKYDRQGKIDYLDEQLSLFSFEYNKLHDIVIHDDQFIQKNVIQISKGVPFQYIGMSRFCFNHCLIMYITYVTLKAEDKQTFNEFDQIDNVIYLTQNKPQLDLLSEYDKDTKKLVKFLQLSLPSQDFLIQKFPDHRHPPASHCKVLEYLFKLLESNSLAEGSSIRLINCPLLTRLQNSLFVALSSCYSTIELNSNRNVQLYSDAVCSGPVIFLKHLYVEKAKLCVKELKESGWRPSDNTPLKRTMSEHTMNQSTSLSLEQEPDVNDTIDQENSRDAMTGDETIKTENSNQTDCRKILTEECPSISNGREETTAESEARQLESSNYPESILEVINAHSLITSPTHELVCRFNALLLVTWSKIVSKQVKEPSSI